MTLTFCPVIVLTLTLPPGRFSDLDLAAVARAFCLLRLPKIAELSDPAVAESFEKERSVDFTAIK